MDKKRVSVKDTGKKISKKLSENNISVKELSSYLDISEQAVYKWFRGESLPTIENFIMLTDLLNCSIEELVVLRKENK